jgi:hypothetical protein
MSDKNKKKTRDEQIEDVQAKMDDARKARLEIAAKRAAAKGKDKQDNYSKFQEYWASERRAYGRDKDLEEILWPHLKAIGHDSPEKFEQGIAHFGLKKGK